MLIKGVIALLVCMLSVSLMAQRMPPNPFINKPVNTTQQLVDHVASDPVVLDRFMRHFQMTKEEVLDMLKTLRPGKLDKDGEYMVFNTQTKTGEIRGKKRHLKKGHLVWVDRSGTPILEFDCANPLVPGREPEPVVAAITGAPAGVKPVQLEFETLAEEVFVFKVNEPMIPAAPPIEFVETPPLTGTVTDVGESPAPFLAPLAFLPTGLLALSGSGGGVIPEPATIITLGTGLTLIAARIRNRKK